MNKQIESKRQRFTFVSGILCLMLCGLVLTYAATGFAVNGEKELLKEALTQGSEDADELKEKKDAADQEKRLTGEGDVKTVSDTGVLP